uniref:Reverse transcriptase Ty1/copia-type domain-containing protein n=1 Tax=Solanum lycopersicum TaxID=4081 RepID=A0A3Q7IVX5_SOLLC
MAVSSSTNGTDTPSADITHFRSLIGALHYLAITRPDIQFAVNRVAQRMHQPSEHDYHCLKRILRYIFGTLGCGLLIRPGDLELRGFSYSDWANDKNDRKSTSGSESFEDLSSKPLHDSIVMTNLSSSKISSSKNRHASTLKDQKTPKKRGRKAAPPIIRPTLPTNSPSPLSPSSSPSPDVPPSPNVPPSPTSSSSDEKVNRQLHLCASFAVGPQQVEVAPPPSPPGRAATAVVGVPNPLTP